MTLGSILTVALGGALGATARYAVGAWTLRALGPGFPWATLAVNVAGSLMMGLAAALLMEKGAGAWRTWALFLMTGVLGGFTTFSAFSLDALTLIERGRAGAAALYMGGSVALAVGALWVGMAVGRAL